MPKLQGRTELTDRMTDCVKSFGQVWDGRDEADNFQQKHDAKTFANRCRPSRGRSPQ